MRYKVITKEQADTIGNIMVSQYRRFSPFTCIQVNGDFAIPESNYDLLKNAGFDTILDSVNFVEESELNNVE